MKDFLMRYPVIILPLICTICTSFALVVLNFMEQQILTEWRREIEMSSYNVRNDFAMQQGFSMHINRSIIALHRENSQREIDEDIFWGCRHFKVTALPEQTLQPRALTSYPGSGNTWLRLLIEATTGIFTGSVYNDRELQITGLYGETFSWSCGCTIVQKTHGFVLNGEQNLEREKVKEVEKFSGQGILLIRNPYKSLVSYRNYIYGGHLGYAHEKQFSGIEWLEFVVSQVNLWKNLAEAWITLADNCLPVHYELLETDLNKTLHQILHHLKLLPNQERIDCVLMQQYDIAKRKQIKLPSQLNRDRFRDTHELVDEAIDSVNSALLARGMEGLPLHLYEGYKHRK